MREGGANEVTIAPGRCAQRGKKADWEKEKKVSYPIKANFLAGTSASQTRVGGKACAGAGLLLLPPLSGLSLTGAALGRRGRLCPAVPSLPLGPDSPGSTGNGPKLPRGPGGLGARRTRGHFGDYRGLACILFRDVFM